MNIKLLNPIKLQNWLKQFKKEDIEKAKSLIEDINFIDQVDYDSYTAEIVKKIEQIAHAYDHVYLIPINSLLCADEPKSDSAFVFNIKKKITFTPTPKWTFADKIENNSVIFFLDEFIGSGNTFYDNINNIELSTLKRIRSLSSFGKIKVYIGSIVLYAQAKQLLSKNFKFIKDFIYEIEGTAFPKKYQTFFEKYVTKKNCRNSLYGYNRAKSPYKGILSNIVFYNNCPNNTPSILWCKQNSSSEPLFFNKKVSLQYQTAYYKEKQEFQKIINYYLNTSNDIDQFKTKEYYSLTIDSLIFLLKRQEMSVTKFQHYSNTSDMKLKAIIKFSYDNKLINSLRRDGQLTKNGKTILSNLLKSYNLFYMHEIKKQDIKECKETLLYYPLQIKGIKLNA